MQDVDSGRDCVYAEKGVHGKSLCLLFNFSVNLKMLKELKFIKKKIKDIKRYPIQLLSIRKLVSLY